MTIRIDINNLMWNVCRDERSGRWVGSCEALKLVAEGDTFSSLAVDMDGAIQDLLHHLLEENELVDFLRTAGWQPKPAFMIPVGIAPEDLQFEDSAAKIKQNAIEECRVRYGRQ